MVTKHRQQNVVINRCILELFAEVAPVFYNSGILKEIGGREGIRIRMINNQIEITIKVRP